MLFSVLCREELFLYSYATLFDTGFLAGEVAEIVKFGATNLTVFVHGNRIDERRFDGEDTLYTDIVAHFANGKTFFSAFSRNADYNTAILLDTLLVAFLDTVSDGDGIAGGEFGVLLAGSGRFLDNLNQIHCTNRFIMLTLFAIFAGCMSCQRLRNRVQS